MMTYEGDLILPISYSPTAAKPIDNRFVVDTENSLWGDIPAIPVDRLYEGLIVFTRDTFKLYAYIGTTGTSTREDWKDLFNFGSSGLRFMGTTTVYPPIYKEGDAPCNGDMWIAGANITTDNGNYETGDMFICGIEETDTTNIITWYLINGENLVTAYDAILRHDSAVIGLDGTPNKKLIATVDGTDIRILTGGDAVFHGSQSIYFLEGSPDGKTKKWWDSFKIGAVNWSGFDYSNKIGLFSFNTASSSVDNPINTTDWKLLVVTDASTGDTWFNGAISLDYKDADGNSAFTGKQVQGTLTNNQVYTWPNLSGEVSIDPCFKLFIALARNVPGIYKVFSLLPTADYDCIGLKMLVIGNNIGNNAPNERYCVPIELRFLYDRNAALESKHVVYSADYNLYNLTILKDVYILTSEAPNAPVYICCNLPYVYSTLTFKISSITHRTFTGITASNVLLEPFETVTLTELEDTPGLFNVAELPGYKANSVSNLVSYGTLYSSNLGNNKIVVTDNHGLLITSDVDKVNLKYLSDHFTNNILFSAENGKLSLSIDITNIDDSTVYKTLTATIPVFAEDADGLVPAPNTSSTYKFLRADGSWGLPGYLSIEITSTSTKSDSIVSASTTTTLTVNVLDSATADPTLIKFLAGNKWINLVGANHTSSGPDTITFGHSTLFTVTLTFGQTKTGDKITIPNTITIDEAGHTTALTESIVSIGGRNLLLNTGAPIKIGISRTPNYGRYEIEVSPEFKRNKLSSDISIIFQYKIKNWTELYYPISIALGKRGSWDSWSIRIQPGDYIQIDPTTRLYYGTQTLTPNDTRLANLDYVTDGSVLLLGLSHATGFEGSVEIYDVKLERGTMLTDWTPAPEDLISAQNYITHKSSNANFELLYNHSWVAKSDFNDNRGWYYSNSQHRTTIPAGNWILYILYTQEPNSQYTDAAIYSSNGDILSTYEKTSNFNSAGLKVLKFRTTTLLNIGIMIKCFESPYYAWLVQGNYNKEFSPSFEDYVREPHSGELDNYVLTYDATSLTHTKWAKMEVADLVNVESGDERLQWNRPVTVATINDTPIDVIQLPQWISSPNTNTVGVYKIFGVKTSGATYDSIFLQFLVVENNVLNYGANSLRYLSPIYTLKFSLNEASGTLFNGRYVELTGDYYMRNLSMPKDVYVGTIHGADYKTAEVIICASCNSWDQFGFNIIRCAGRSDATVGSGLPVTIYNEKIADLSLGDDGYYHSADLANYKFTSLYELNGYTKLYSTNLVANRIANTDSRGLLTTNDNWIIGSLNLLSGTLVPILMHYPTTGYTQNWVYSMDPIYSNKRVFITDFYMSFKVDNWTHDNTPPITSVVLGDSGQGTDAWSTRIYFNAVDYDIISSTTRRYYGHVCCNVNSRIGSNVGFICEAVKYNDGTIDTNTYTIYDVKLETGYTRTDWSPSYRDFVSNPSTKLSWYLSYLDQSKRSYGALVSGGNGSHNGIYIGEHDDPYSNGGLIGYQKDADGNVTGAYTANLVIKSWYGLQIGSDCNKVGAVIGINCRNGNLEKFGDLTDHGTITGDNLHTGNAVRGAGHLYLVGAKSGDTGDGIVDIWNKLNGKSLASFDSSIATYNIPIDIRKIGYKSFDAIDSLLYNLWLILRAMQSGGHTYAPGIGFEENGSADATLFMHNRSLYLTSAGSNGDDIRAAKGKYKILHTGNYEYVRAGTRDEIKDSPNWWENTTSAESFIGTQVVNGTWESIISLRHRGGKGDGYAWGNLIWTSLEVGTDGISPWYYKKQNGATGNWRATHRFLDDIDLQMCSITCTASECGWRKVAQFSHEQGRRFILHLHGKHGENVLQDATYAVITISCNWVGDGYGWGGTVRDFSGYSTNDLPAFWLQAPESRGGTAYLWMNGSTGNWSSFYLYSAVPVRGACYLYSSSAALTGPDTSPVYVFQLPVMLYELKGAGKKYKLLLNNITHGDEDGLDLGTFYAPETEPSQTLGNNAVVKFNRAHSAAEWGTIAPIIQSYADDIYLTGIGSIPLNNTALSNNTLYCNAKVYCRNGNLYANSMYLTSDDRLKDYIDNCDFELDKIHTIPIKTFTYKSDSTNTIQYGTSALEVQKNYPYLVSEDPKTSIKSVDYAKLSLVAIDAIKKLDKRVLELEEEIKKLKQNGSNLVL